MKDIYETVFEKELISILLIDDDEEDYLITRDLVEDINHQQFTLDWISSYEKGLELMCQNMHDVYLIDYRLGAKTGLDLLKAALKRGVNTPIILLTGQGDFEVDTLAMKSGAADYLIKSELTPDRLERSIRYSIQQMHNLQKIRQLAQDLEERVAARTEALAMAVKDLEAQIAVNKEKEEQLKKNEEHLKRALAKEQQVNELKSRFVSMASHEFRTPLATILSSLTLVERYEKPEHKEKKQKHIERIKSNVHTLTNVLDDFLSLSKLEEGKIKIHPSLVRVEEMLEEIKDEMQHQAKDGQQIELKFETDEEFLWLDGMLIRNSLNNLLSNAIKYSPENSKILLSGYVKGEQISILVQDKGIGIPEDEQEHMFERFFRARNATHIKGTGLGLSIVKRYVDMMGGTISFHSTPEKGTTFTIHLHKLRPES